MQGRGVGRILLRELESWATRVGYARIILSTLLENLGACAFYCACGFSKTRTEPWDPAAVPELAAKGANGCLSVVLFEKRLA